MEKMKMQTTDIANENFLKLAALFPNAVTETIDENGEVVRAIDKDILMQEISTRVVEGNEERYQFTWPDKRQAMRLASTPIAATLRPCREESVNFDTTQNLYIEGDNLDVLKLLRETYLGKVKMIYIDPPYNTGNDFVYDDAIFIDDEEFKYRDNQYDAQGNRLVQNTESNGRFHTDWLNMIYPRLKVAKDLLADDGVIFISIGEHEICNLKKCCVEIFGKQNFIETYIWESTFRPDNSSKIMRRNAEYIICVAKNKSNISELLGEIKNKDGLPSLTKSSMKESVLSFPANTVITYLKNGIYKAGKRESYELLDDVEVKNGKIINSFSLKGHMIWSQANLEKEMKNGTQIIIKGDGFVPYTKKIGDSQMSPTKLIPKSIVGDILSANAELAALFPEQVFSYPKPVSLLSYLIRYFREKDFTVMDFFSGSSTTAEAVISVNVADGGNRNFILVQLPENLNENLKGANAKANETIENAIKLCDKLGRPHLLTEIGKERIRRAGEKILAECAARTNGGGNGDGSGDCSGVPDLDIGFRVLKLDSSNMEDVYYAPDKTSQNDLLSLISNIKPDRTPEDLLFQVMLEFGITLDSKIEETVISGKKVFKVAGNFLIACFDENVTDEVVKAIAQEQPTYAVLRDSSFANDSVAANFEQIFATYSPDTVRRVL